MEVSDVGKGIPNLRLSTVKMPEETTGGFATAKVLPSASMANHGSMAADRESPGLLPAMKARRAFGKTHALQEDVMAVAAPPAMILRESATPDSEAASKPRAPDNRKAKADSPAAKSSLGAPTAETDKAAASLPATSGKGVQVDVQTIAEQVERIIARKLIVERERRGVQSWR
jgi:hypothetical protein